MDDYAQLQIHYAGQQACFECHQDIEDLKAQDVHSQINCETCHGPGQKHVESSALADILKPAGREFCGRCHSMNAAKKKDAIFQIDLKEHNTDKNCIECHNPHQPWEVKK
jgi:DnaJ-class molecular chaperone